jgi:hypothetical protein
VRLPIGSPSRRWAGSKRCCGGGHRLSLVTELQALQAQSAYRRVPYRATDLSALIDGRCASSTARRKRAADLRSTITPRLRRMHCHPRARCMRIPTRLQCTAFEHFTTIPCTQYNTDCRNATAPQPCASNSYGEIGWRCDHSALLRSPRTVDAPTRCGIPQRTEARLGSARLGSARLGSACSMSLPSATVAVSHRIHRVNWSSLRASVGGGNPLKFGDVLTLLWTGDVSRAELQVTSAESELRCALAHRSGRQCACVTSCFA